MLTPCLPSQRLSELWAAELTLKFENLQHCSSFKDRGAYVKLASLTDQERARGVIAMSAGNHAQGVAWHAPALGIPATIVMPRLTPFVKVEKTAQFGAKVVLEGDSVDDAVGVRAHDRGRARPDLRPSLRRSADHRGPGHDRAGDAGRRARTWTCWWCRSAAAA